MSGLFPFLFVLIVSVGGACSEEMCGDIAESQSKGGGFIEDSGVKNEESRSLLSLSNIQNDIWSEQFANGFSSIELEDSRSGLVHSLEDSSSIKLGRSEYIITSSNMPKHDSLILFFENIRPVPDSNTENGESLDKSLLIVINETENEILIRSSKLSDGFTCVGLLNGTEIWSREFCEIVQDSASDGISCSCKGSFIYSLVESRDEKRALQMQYTKFNFPDLANSDGSASAHHVNDAYLSRVSRNDDPNSNHGDKVPFPPLHGSIGGRSGGGVSVQKTEPHQTSPKSEATFGQNELMQYYHSGPATKFVISSPDSDHTFDKSKLNELSHKSLASKEANRVNSNLNGNSNPPRTPWETNKQKTHLKESNSTAHNKLNIDLSKPKIDSVTINIKLNNLSYESLGNQVYRQNFSSKLINTLSAAINVVPGKLRIVNIWSEDTSPLLRGNNSRSVGVAVNIMTSVPNETISKIVALNSQICEFSKVFDFSLISISKNIGSKSVSNEVITDKSKDSKERAYVSGGDLLRTLPIVFTMDLRTKKPHINQKEAFTLLEDELSRSMKIPKSLIDIPEFTYKQLSDPYTNEVYLMIHTEIWVHPDKQEREEYSALLTNIYSNIIHNKRSAFSKIFLCSKHEIKEVPRIRAHPARDEKALNKGRPGSSGAGMDTNRESYTVDEGRISKIGGFYQINQKNHNDSRAQHSNEAHEGHPNIYGQSEREDTNIHPVIYLFE